jgi:RNA polymerase subunit RPABC4/transcription elongation factor Spt4
MEEILTICRNCNATIDGNVKFCTECGAKVVREHICSGCGAILDEKNKFCTKCGAQIGNSNVAIVVPPKRKSKKQNSYDNYAEMPDKPKINKIKLKSIEEAEAFLSNLQTHASDSVAEALKAQLTVIRYIKSPSLVDTTFDTLLLSLKKALQYAESLKMKNEIRERYSLMIQNYIFFFDARLQFEINKEAYESYKVAGEMLLQSVTAVSMLAISATSLAASQGGISVGHNEAIVSMNNIFKPDNQGESLFSKLITQWKKNAMIETKRGEYYKILYNIFIKLDQYYVLIGPSMLIKGAIERYVDEIVDYLFPASKKYTFWKAVLDIFLLFSGLIIYKWMWLAFKEMGRTDTHIMGIRVRITFGESVLLGTGMGLLAVLIYWVSDMYPENGFLMFLCVLLTVFGGIFIGICLRPLINLIIKEYKRFSIKKRLNRIAVRFSEY